VRRVRPRREEQEPGRRAQCRQCGIAQPPCETEADVAACAVANQDDPGRLDRELADEEVVGADGVLEVARPRSMKDEAVLDRVDPVEGAVLRTRSGSKASVKFKQRRTQSSPSLTFINRRGIPAEADESPSAKPGQDDDSEAGVETHEPIRPPRTHCHARVIRRGSCSGEDTVSVRLRRNQGEGGAWRMDAPEADEPFLSFALGHGRSTSGLGPDEDADTILKVHLGIKQYAGPVFHRQRWRPKEVGLPPGLRRCSVGRPGTERSVRQSKQNGQVTHPGDLDSLTERPGWSSPRSDEVVCDVAAELPTRSAVGRLRRAVAADGIG